MNDKELIERLRYCGADCDMEICGRCPDYEKVNCMEELMTAAANRISDLLAEIRDEKHRHDRYVDFELDQAEELRKLKETTRWIPVSERMPDTIPCGAGTEYSEAINILTAERKVLTAIWDGHEFIADAEFWEAETEEITHWTPVLLPLPPNKEETV